MSENEQLNGSTGSGQNENQLRQKFQEVWQNKNYRVIICVVAALIVLYVGHGFYVTSHYESKCQDFIEILSRANKLADKLNTVNGDPNDKDTKAAIEELGDLADETKSLNESFKSLTPPGGKEGERNQITDYLDKYEILFRNTHQVSITEGYLIKSLNPEGYKKAEALVKEFGITYRALDKIPQLL